MTSAADVLGMIGDRLSPVLVAPGALARLCARARDLPALPVGGLECRLGQGPRDPDFGLLGSIGNGGREALSTWDDPLARALSEAWRQNDDLRTVGIELDAPDWSPAGIFVSLREASAAPPWTAALEVAARLGMVPATAVVDEVLAKLPAAVTVHTFGFMRGRTPTFVRLNVGGTIGACLPACLRAVGWSGDLAAVSQLVDWIGPAIDFFVACLDVGERLSPRLGLECFFASPARFIDLLVARGLCTPEEAEALIAWPCRGMSFRSLGLRVPAALRWIDIHTPGAIATSINHVKLDFTDAGLHAKAYLAYQFGWRRTAS